MNNSLIDIITGKERKKYKQIIRLIELHNSSDLFKTRDVNFGLKNSKYIENVETKLELELMKDSNFLLQMNYYKFPKATDFNKKLIKANPQIVEIFLENEIDKKELLNYALDNGYKPSTDYINNNPKHFFSDADIMNKLLDLGYRPSDEMIEKNTSDIYDDESVSFREKNIFSDEKLFLRAIEWGYIPSLRFIKNNQLLKKPNLVDVIIEKVDITPDILNSDLFYDNVLAQRSIIKNKPSLLTNLQFYDANIPFWIEAIKMGYNSDKIIERFGNNPVVFSKLIRQNPECIKYFSNRYNEERNNLDELALCMGYIPSVGDAQTFKYIKSSPKLMRALITKRPEAIKYLSTEYDLSFDDFIDLIRFAIDSGYIPTLNDLNYNPRLAKSFDFMKVIIADNPNAINDIDEHVSNQEQLLKIAIDNGFDGEIVPVYKETANIEYATPDRIGKGIPNSLLKTETGIMYQINHGKKIDNSLRYSNHYSIDLYNFLIDKGYQIKDIVNLFTSNFEVMKEIISKEPNYITIVDHMLDRTEIDTLSFLAIEKGYIPKIEDEIFGYGSEINKLIVKMFPDYIEKVHESNFWLGKGEIPLNIWNEICKIALDNGYEIKPDNYNQITAKKYCKNYDFMKKLIQVNPILINDCDIVDKQQYDELCNIAISSGYKPIGDYVLTNNNSRLNTNYNIMSMYVAYNPKLILYAELSSKDEMVKLIDLAITSGLNLKEIDKKELFQLFSKIEESEWGNYLDFDIINEFKEFNEMFNNNSSAYLTADERFFDKYIIENFTKSQIEILSCYPKIQKDIVETSPYERKIIFDLVNKYSDNLEWVPILEKVLENFKSKEFHNLLSSISYNKLSENEKDNLLLLLMTDNHLDISYSDDLKKIDSIKTDYINKLIERNSIGSLKTAYFEKVYGIDLMTAIEMIELYGKILESDSFNLLDDKNKSEFVLLDNMKKIININNVELLKYYINNINPDFIITPDLMITYQAKLKYIITKEFNNSFTKPLEEDRLISRIDEEKNYNIYLAAGHDGNKKCRMMITSLGAYSNAKEPDDYYASWNVNSIASHGCCCSYVGEKNLGTAIIRYCCLGFTDYEPGSLHISAPYDLCSKSSDDSYEVASTFKPMYLLPEDVLNYTRHTHNETVWERRNINENSLFKKQPSYIVYFVDNFEDRLTDPEAMKQWESVKKAANNFSIIKDGKKQPLPIMVVEREKIAKSQIGIINEKLNEFSETLNPRLIKDIITDYESNYAGNRDYHLNISEKYFPQHEHLKESVVGKIIEQIQAVYEKNPNIALQCIIELEKTVKSEQEKYNHTQHGVGQSLPSFNIEEALTNINELKSKFKLGLDSTIVTINNCDNNERQYEKSDIPNIDHDKVDLQLSSSDVISILSENELSTKLVLNENEINEERVNSNLKVHGQRHIKNVLLYSAIIGNEVLKDEHDLDLVMASAKYHDVGRKTDAHEEHAEASSDIAIERLKEKYSEEDLSIIKTIIEFHETSRNIPNIDEVFIKMARKNGVSDEEISRTRKMAEILKDADALDRTRFINKARLNPEFLQYDISKNLVKFASSMQETYAITDLKEFHCDEAIDILLQMYTPQEVIRTIRHSTRGLTNESDIQNFITSWAKASVEQNLDNNSNITNERGSVKHER